MGTRAIVNRDFETRYCEHGYYVTMDGYPDSLGRAILNGKPELPCHPSRPNNPPACRHTPQEIAEGAHSLGAAISCGKYGSAADWAYWMDDKGQWRAAKLPGRPHQEPEVHSLKGWLFGNKGRPLRGA